MMMQLDYLNLLINSMKGIDNIVFRVERDFGSLPHLDRTSQDDINTFLRHKLSLSATRDTSCSRNYIRGMSLELWLDTISTFVLPDLIGVYLEEITDGQPQFQPC